MERSVIHFKLIWLCFSLPACLAAWTKVMLLIPFCFVTHTKFIYTTTFLSRCHWVFHSKNQKIKKDSFRNETHQTVKAKHCYGCLSSPVCQQSGWLCNCSDQDICLSNICCDKLCLLNICTRLFICFLNFEIDCIISTFYKNALVMRLYDT